MLQNRLVGYAQIVSLFISNPPSPRHALSNNIIPGWVPPLLQWTCTCLIVPTTNRFCRDTHVKVDCPSLQRQQVENACLRNTQPFIRQMIWRISLTRESLWVAPCMYLGVWFVLIADYSLPRSDMMSSSTCIMLTIPFHVLVFTVVLCQPKGALDT